MKPIIFEKIIPNNVNEKLTYEFNLTDCPFKKIPSDVNYTNNEFNFELPVSKAKINPVHAAVRS